MALFNGNGGFSGREILYGTSDGKVGLLEMGNDEPLPKWELPNDKRLAGISCMDNYDILNDGVLDLIIGRDDGVIEVYGYDSMDNPVLKYTYVRIKVLKKKICNDIRVFFL